MSKASPDKASQPRAPSPPKGDGAAPAVVAATDAPAQAARFVATENVPREMAYGPGATGRIERGASFEAAPADADRAARLVSIGYARPA